MSMVGKTLGNFTLEAQIGKGGMGEVYRAKDQKLGRDVAIKVLPEEFAKDADRVARFQREAKLLASLNHPNIAAIHGLEESDGTHFLVLELIEGDTLADRLKRGAIPAEESLKLALQIAEALEAAHEKGVIHRDLKPANIKVTPDGKVKVLDFGLAKAFAGDQSDPNLSNSPTLSVAATQQGIILGTAAYMSPEQASGEIVDKRSDIWAFGVVLYEMLTGRSLFGGDNVSQTLARVLERQPDFSTLPPNLHSRIRLLLERCLEKTANDRYHDIADVRVDIKKALADPDGVLPKSASTAEEPRTRLRHMLPGLAATLIIGAIIAGVAVWKLKPTEPKQITRFNYDLPNGQQLGNLEERAFTVSPDGTQFVYRTDEGLYLRRMDELEARLISGTEENPQKPFYSPDGKWLGYVSGEDNRLKKISINGGTSSPLTVARSTGFLSWGTDDAIVYGEGGNIMKVSANGGNPVILVEGTGEGSVIAPKILPDGKTVMYTRGPAPFKIMVHSLESGETKELISVGDTAQYLQTGHIIYGAGNNLCAVPFDLQKLELTGESVIVIDDVLRGGGAPQYAVSDLGILVYLPGTASGYSQLAWYDRQGNQIEKVGEPASNNQFSLSPDEKRVVLERNSAESLIYSSLGSLHLWVLELDRAGGGFPIASGLPVERDPIWSPDGDYIAFRSGQKLYRQSLAGEEEPELLLELKGDLNPEDWSDDGNFIAYLRYSVTGQEIGVLEMLEDRPSKPVVQGKFNYAEPNFSPDNQWIAYTSDETGQNEVWIKPFPGEGRGKPISIGGGSQPQWRADGKELFYLAPDGLMMAIGMGGEQFTPGTPEPLFQTEILVDRTWDQYAVSRDGQRFIMLVPGQEDRVSSFNVVLNWFEELKKKVPVD